MNGAFQSAALELHARGIAVVPAGGDDGKTPLVNGWSRWKGQRRETVEAFALKFSDANIGIVTGLSRLTVIDADDEKTLADAENRFGQSPLVTRSPRGGGHLYYRSSGERNANLRPFGLNVDIRGEGGMVVIPPSVRPRVGAYRIERGSWDDVARLKTLHPDAIPTREARVNRRDNGSYRAEGARNTGLFLALKACAGDCQTLGELVAEAHAINALYAPPLPRGEAEKVAGSIWRMKIGGRLIKRGQQRIQMRPGELERLSADAFYLLGWVRRWHGAKHGPFALVAKAMAKAEVIPGWGTRRYVAAILELRASGDLVRTHKGGAKSGDPSLYRMGAPSEPNITNTPLPGAPPVVNQGFQH